MAGKELSFYNVKAKKKFKTTKYRTVIKNGRKFAVAKVPNADFEAWRVLGKA